MKKSKRRLLIEKALFLYNEEVILYSKSWIISKYSDNFVCYIYHIRCFTNVHSFSYSNKCCNECRTRIPDNVLVTFKMLAGD